MGIDYWSLEWEFISIWEAIYELIRVIIRSTFLFRMACLRIGILAGRTTCLQLTIFLYHINTDVQRVFLYSKCSSFVSSHNFYDLTSLLRFSSTDNLPECFSPFLK